MKTIINFTLLLFTFSSIAYSQIGIGTDDPDGSAILDISSNDKGILIPRVSDATISAMTTPAKGLLVYNDDYAKFQYYDGWQWLDIKADNGISTNTIIMNTDADVSVDTEENLAEKRITMRAATQQVMSIDTGVANILPPVTLGDNPYAIAKSRLDIDGRLKLSDDTISPPEAGMIRWNTESEDFEGHNGGEWLSLTSKSTFGKSIPKYYATNTITSNEDFKYVGSMINNSSEKSSYTRYDNQNTFTRIETKVGLDLQSIVINESLTNPKYNALQQGEDWMAYVDGTTVRTWKYTGSSYVEQDEITGINHARFINSDKLLTLENNYPLSYIRYWEFKENSNQWELIDERTPIDYDHKIETSGSYIASYLGITGEITTYQVDNNSINDLGSTTAVQDILSMAIDSTVLVVADKYNPNTNDIRILSLSTINPSFTYDNIFIPLPFIGEIPKVTLEIKDDILVVGIANAHNEQGIRTGKVLIYEIRNGDFHLKAELMPSQSQEGMEFGRTISIHEDYIRVAAPLLDINGTADRGAIFEYARN